MGFRLDVPSVINRGDITDNPLLAGVGQTRRIGPGLLETVAQLGSLRDAASNLGLEQDLAWQYLVAAKDRKSVV